MASTALKLLRASPTAFTKYLQKDLGLNGFHMVSRGSGLVASTPELQEVADYLTSQGGDYEGHEAIFARIGPTSQVLQGAFVHRTCRGPSAGGVRNWLYPTMEDWFKDGLRLSKGMTHKNALAGLWWGGGKGVMVRNSGKGLGTEDSLDARKVVYEEYGEFMSLLRGCYVTAEDAGTNVQDMERIFSKTRFTTCIPPALGGSGNPSVPTARGVLVGLKATLEFLGKDLKDCHIAVQGVGNVGYPLVKFLLEAGVPRITACDVDPAMVARAQKSLPGDRVTTTLDKMGDLSILSTDCDVLMPCATGNILNKNTIPQIRAKVICGAANNQLGDITQDDLRLRERGVVYVPDFLVNRMGIVTCADEAAGYLVQKDDLIERHLEKDWEHSIYQVTQSILTRATEKTPQQIALELAEERSRMTHPIFGHRSLDIITQLTQSKEWQDFLVLRKI